MKELLLILVMLTAHCSLKAQHYGWVDISNNLPDSVRVFDGFAIDKHVWLVGEWEKLFYSADGGASFVTHNLPEGIFFTRSIYMKNENEGYLVTSGGYIFYSTDATNGNWQLLYNTRKVLNSVTMPPTRDRVFACGDFGSILSFTNDEYLDMTMPTLSARLTSIMFHKNAEEGHLTGSSTIRRFYNNSWNNLQIHSLAGDGEGSSIFFVDDTTGWVASTLNYDSGRILKTVDGITYNPQFDTHETFLFEDIFFISQHEGWTVGNNVIYHTSNAGDNWERQAQDITNNRFLSAVFFISSNEGYALGEHNFLKYTLITESDSTNATLSTININGDLLNNFTPNIYDYSVGLPPGTTEIPQVTATASVSGATVNITQATTLPGTATIVVIAEDGLIQQTYTINFTLVTGIENIKRPDALSIFPNPVHDMFKIQSSTIKLENAEIEIYDLNGRKLLDKHIIAGTNNAEIDVSHFKNGVYFCRLLAEKYSATQKLIIQN